MANSSLALMVRPPKADLGGILNTAAGLEESDARLRSSGITSSLNELKLADATDESSALRGYRTALASGDKAGAKKAIAGYPELQAQFHKAFQSMKPDEKKIATDRITAIGGVARELSAFPEGSPERAAAAQRLLPGLVKAGYISPEVASHVSKTGVPDALIEQAQTAESWISGKVKEKDTLTSKDNIDIEKAVNDFSKNYFGDNNTAYLEPAQIQARDAAVEKYRQDLIARVTPGRKVSAPRSNLLSLAPRRQPTVAPAAAAAPNIMSNTPMAEQGGSGLSTKPLTSGDGKTKEAPVQFTPGKEEDDFKALPSGAWFTNPADGRVLVKK